METSKPHLYKEKQGVCFSELLEQLEEAETMIEIVFQNKWA